MFRALLLSIALAALPACQRDNAAYRELIRRYHETLDVENQAFERLVFTVSDRKFSASLNFKAILRDQLGREWLFKAGPASGADGAVASYHVFRMFGLPTPEIHYKTLRINNDDVSGSIQRFVPNIGDLRTLKVMNYGGLPAAVQESLARNQVMSWLLANYQVHGGQFLALSDDGNSLKDVMRVDNAIEWPLLGHDRLAADYKSPFLWDIPNGGYESFWRAYVLGHLLENRLGSMDEKLQKGMEAWHVPPMELDLGKVYRWVEFIAAFPDDEYRKFFDLVVENKLAHASNAARGYQYGIAPAIMSKADPKAFLTLEMERKNSLAKDFARFFGELAEAAGEKPDLSTPADTAAIARGIIAGLDAAEAAHRQELTRLAALPPAVQEPLSYKQDFKIYALLLPLAKLTNRPRAARSSLLSAAVDEIERYYRKASGIEDRSRLLAVLDNLQAVQTCLANKAPARTFRLAGLMNTNKFFEHGWINPHQCHLLGPADGEN